MQGECSPELSAVNWIKVAHCDFYTKKPKGADYSGPGEICLPPIRLPKPAQCSREPTVLPEEEIHLVVWTLMVSLGEQRWDGATSILI